MLGLFVTSLCEGALGFLKGPYFFGEIRSLCSNLGIKANAAAFQTCVSSGEEEVQERERQEERERQTKRDKDRSERERQKDFFLLIL